MKRKLSRTQIICIILLWLALCYIILAYSKQIDGMTIATLLISAGFVFVPVYRSLKKE